MPIRPALLVLSIILLSAAFNVSAESVNEKDDTNVTLQDLVDKIKGSGVTITNPVYTGNNAQSGLFSGYNFLLGNDFDTGVLISSGSAVNVVGANTAGNTTTDFPGGSVNDPDLGNPVYDPVKLTMDVVPTENTLIVDYVFGSEEYDEYVNMGFNDNIRVLVDGSNCALTADGQIVSIDSVNNTTNSFLYTDNTPQVVPTQMDGFTSRISCRFSVVPNTPVSVVIGLADVADGQWDSWAFIRAQSLRSEPSNEFGDAPDSYQTLLSSNGAAHVIVEGVSLGELPDGDTNGFHDGIDDSAGAAADDANDDGVITFPNLVDTDTAYSINVEGTSINGSGSDIIAWIDFDRNGQFEPDEASNVATLASGDYKQIKTLSWNNIGSTGPDILLGPTYARVRIVNSGSGIGPLNMNGSFASGEVEDYILQISGLGDATDPVVSIDTPPVVTTTNQTIYTVSGTCTAGDNNVFVDISNPLNGAEDATPADQFVICNGGGKWTAVFDVSAISDGVGVIAVDASQQDANSNVGNAVQQVGDKDVNGPTVNILNAPAITNGVFTATFEFNEDVTGFTLGEITVGNATASNLIAVDANTYTADITPDTTGNITIDVAANVAQDAANNNNIAATQVQITFDNTAPVVSITVAPIANAGNVATYTVSGNCTNGDGLVTVGITGATPASQDVSCTGGGAWSAVFDVSAISDGSNAINITASQTDTATNIGSDNATADKESDVPGVDIQGEPAFVNSFVPFNVTFEFTEDVTGFDISDITVNNATKSAFVAVDGNTYTADIAANGGGNITIDVAANVAQDGAANNNTAASQATVLFDNTAPVVTINSIPVANAANYASYSVSGGCENGDGNVTVSIAGATPSPQSVACSSATWNASFDLTAIGDGSNVVTVNASQTDAFTNTGNAPTQQTDKDVVIVIPTVDVLLTNDVTPVLSGTAEANSSITVTVAGATYYTVTNGSGIWSVDTTTPDSGVFNPNINGSNSVFTLSTDAANNSASDVTTNELVIDTTVPGVSISGAPTATNAPNFNITITFSEAVNNFVVGDIAASNATVGSFAGGPTVYTVTVTPTGGDITLDVNAGVATDDAGNNNTAAAQVNVVYDVTSPGVVISGAPATTNDAPFGITVTFDEDVSNFVVGDISVTNATVGSFAGGPAVYTATVTPTGGAITLDVNAAVASDASGNDNTAAAQVNVAYDNTAPSVAISGAPATTNNTPFGITVTFDEDVSGFIVGDISVSNATVGGFAGGPAVYTATVTPTGGAITLDVNAAVATDASGNDNTAASQVNIAYDNTAPGVVISGAPATTNNTPFGITVTFDEDVSGFVVGDISVTNATVGGFAGGPSIYTATVTPTGGAITLDVNAAVATDASGNDNTAAAQVAVAYDNTAPSVAISGAPATTNNTPFGITVTFDEDVSSFVVGDISVSNATVGGFAGGPAVYTATVNPTGGAITLDVNAAVASDASGNDNTAAAQVAVAYDAVAPAVVISGAPTTTNNTPFGITVTFDEDVSGFVLADITTVNATVGSFAGGPAVYTATVTPTGGAITLDINAAVATDASGNDNTAASQVNIAYDNTAPGVVISGAPATTNNTPFGITVTFDEDVSNFVVGDIAVTNATVGSFAGGPSAYTATVTPTGGAITLDVNAAVASDASGNDNTAAAQVAVAYDNTAPAVAISGAPATTNNTPFGITVTFDEDVSGFVVGDISVTNATVGGFAGGPSIYTATVTPTGGAITLDVNAAVATDASGNDNTAAAQVAVAYDNTAPGVVISGAPTTTNNTPFGITVTFDEDVSGFVVGDISVSNATVGGFAGGPAVYTATVTPTSGAITLDVNAAVASDASGNDNTAATQVNVAYDNTAPAVAISGAPATTNNMPFGIMVTFDEDVSGFVVGDISVTNATVGSFAGGPAVYTATVTPTGGAITLDVNAAVAQDASGNDNIAATQVSVAYDNTAPGVDILGEPATINSLSSFAVSFEFTEDVTGFDVSDVIVVNASAGNFIAVDANTYTADITPNGSGDISIDVPASVTQDLSGNNNTAAAQANVVFDNVAPVVVISSAPDANQANESALPVSGSCTIGDGNVTVELTSPPMLPLSNSVVCDGTGNWNTSFDVSAISDGVAVINIAANQTDAANNQGDAVGIQRDKDVVLPTVQIQNAPVSANDLTEFVVNVEFSEDVTGFIGTDVAVTNATVSSFAAVDGNTYNVGITPDGNGDISINIAADVAQDSVLNGNTVAAQVDVSFDNVAPGVSIQNAPAIVNSVSAYNVTFKFSETVTGFTVADIAVLNASVSNFAGSNDTYTADITPDGAGDISIDVNAGVAQDAAANDNTAAVQVVTVFDNVKPDVSIQNAPVAVNATTAFSVTFSFSETVTGFAVGDITAVNATVGNFAGSGSTYTADITPDGAGNISINVAADVAQDAASNTNNAATQVDVIFDNVKPDVDILGEPANANSLTSFAVSIKFNEDVSGFVLGDVTLNNATGSNFVGVDAQTYTLDVTPSGAGDISIDVAADVAQDIAGNGNNATVQAVIAFDNTAPVVSIVNASTVNAANQASYTVDGSCTTGDGDVTVSIVGAAPATQDVSCVAGNWSSSFDVTAIADGSNAVTIDASQTDAAANTGNALTVSVDKDVVIAAPTVDLLTTNSSTPVITGTAEADSALTIDVAGASYSLTADPSGLWSLDTAVATPDSGTFVLQPGANEVVMTSTDAAGNSANDASTNEVTLSLDDDGDGIPNAVECPTGPPFDNSCPDTDGDGIPDFQETDSDNDGIDDATEVGLDPNNPIDTDGDGIPDYQDTDSDNDGIDDVVETTSDSDGDGIPDYVDAGSAGPGAGDSDGDGIPDSVECPAYPSCPDSDADGQPDYMEIDSDDDGITDAVEAGIDPTMPLDTDGDGTPDYQDLDSDGDNTIDNIEGVIDADNDGIPDYVDADSAGPGAGDSDGDGIADDIECEIYPLCPDSDGDSMPDYMEVDSDNDGINDAVEVGTVLNDADNDGIDDALDVDVTGGLDLNSDGIDDSLPLDTDGDGTPDYQDTDSDGDTVTDVSEGVIDTDGDGIPDYLDVDSTNVAATADGSGDSDADGISDLDECLGGLPCPDVDQDGLPDYMDAKANDGPAGDNDGDGTPNYLDPDDDNDNIPDVVEDPDFDMDNDPSTNALDSDADGTPDYLDTDSDNDMLSDAAESGATSNDADGDNIVDTYDVDFTGGNDADNDGIDDDVLPLDSDGDTLPDYLDTVFNGNPGAADSDNDGIKDIIECPIFPTNCPDSDTDGTPDFLEVDSDNDTILDAVEAGVNPNVPLDSDGDGTPDYQDTDSDNDGADDVVEGLVDADSDGIPDYVDADNSGAAYGGDSDGDGVEDLAECGSYPACADTDGDGTPDYMDADSRPYDPNDTINTGVKGSGSNAPWTMLIMLMVFIFGRGPGKQCCDVRGNICGNIRGNKNNSNR